MTIEPEYLSIQQVADRIQVKRSTICEYLSRGTIPEPDLIFMRHPLWLPETIDEWRDNMAYKTKDRPNRKKTGKRHRKKPILKRSEKIKAPDAATGRRPPRVKAQPSSNGASATPTVSVVSETIAKQIASALRSAGHHCTTDDVLVLAGSSGEPDHERDLLRQRIQSKLRGLKARKV